MAPSMTGTMPRAGVSDMHVKTSAPLMDASRALAQALSDLEDVKQQLQRPELSKDEIAASLGRIEEGLKKQSEDLVTASWSASRQVEPEIMQHIKQSAQVLGVRFRTRPMPHAAATAAQQQAAQKANFLEKPQTKAARTYLQARFGVAAPTKSPSRQDSGGGFGAGAVSRGLTQASQASIILPRHLRDNPHAITPPVACDLEMAKGLYHMTNRGLLPPQSDLTPALVGEAGLMTSGAALHQHAAQFQKTAPTSALEDSLLAACTNHFKLDLLTPIVKPVERSQPATLRLVSIGASTGAPLGGTAGGTANEVPDNATSGAEEKPAEEGRPYDVLMDAFSLHELMIRKGVAIRTTPEFVSFQRTYTHLWGVLDALVGQLEALCGQYLIPLAIVDGKSLAELAGSIAHSGYAPQVQDLLVCFRNIQEVAAVIKQPGRRLLGTTGETVVYPQPEDTTSLPAGAAHHAASAIQTAWRNSRLRTQLHKRLRGARATRNAQFAALQQRLHDTWPLMQHTAHVVVHVPSLRPGGSSAGLGAGSCRLSSSEADALTLLEAAQLARLCDLSEPLLEVLLVLPSPPNADVISYWNKILEVGGVVNPLDRYKIVYPENHARLPMHMSTAAKLLASPRALKRLRVSLNGRLSYLVPGGVGGEEVDLAVALGAPLLGPLPSTFAALTKKSAARQLFKAALANIAPGTEVKARADELPPLPALPGDVHAVRPLQAGTEFNMSADGEIIMTEPEVVTALCIRSQYEADEAKLLLRLAETMVRHPSRTKWLLKIDDHMMGCGHAFVDGGTLKGLGDVLDRAWTEAGGRDADTYAHTLPPFQEQQRVCVLRINNILWKQLPKKLMIAARDVYPTYRDFVVAFIDRGGVIEACPQTPVGSPSVNMFIDPTGGVSVLSTHEKVFVYPFRSVGTIFPQNSMPHLAVAEAASAIGSACYGAGVIGHVTVDFVALQERDGALRLWVVDLSPHITPSLMAFQLFDFLAVGTFNPLTGSYSVESDACDDASSTANSSSGAESGTGRPPEMAFSQRPASGGGERAARLLSGRAAGPVGGPRGQVVRPLPPPPLRSSPGSPSTSQRCYLALDVVSHPTIKATPCAKFFHSCWKNNLSFDVDNRYGVFFNLSDRYMSGALGIVSVGVVPADAYRRMQAALSFLGSRDVDVTQRAAWHTNGFDLAQFQDMQALLKYMVEAV